jgi:hypothetical protein
VFSFLRLAQPFLDAAQAFEVLLDLSSVVVDAVAVLSDYLAGTLQPRQQLDAAEVVRLGVVHHAGEGSSAH